jgi:NADH:ubiquinone oxidoreductase subunit F (NADH-binding)
MRKKCIVCGARKMIKFFSKDSSREDELSVKCKQCSSAYRKMLRIKHKMEELKARQENQSDFSVSFD